MRSYNVLNDRILAPSAGSIEYKQQQVAGSHRHWPLTSLQSAQRRQSAAGEHLTASPVATVPLLMCYAVESIQPDDIQHREASRHHESRAKIKSAVLQRTLSHSKCFGEHRLRVHDACMSVRV